MTPSLSRSQKCSLLLCGLLAIAVPLAVGCGGKTTPARSGYRPISPGVYAPRPPVYNPPAVPAPPQRRTCIQCNGRGFRACYGCWGSGRAYGTVCGNCHGAGTVRCPSMFCTAR